MLMAVLLTLGCKDNNPDPKEYDRAALTANLGENVILPAYADLSLEVDRLDQKVASFRHLHDAASLDSLQAALSQAWRAWKTCSAFEFGPAATVSLRSILNTFPSDSTQIHNNFSAGSWDLNLAANIDARGFPALDFLLFGLGTDDAAILRRYESGIDSTKLQNYLAAVVADLHANIITVVNQWNGGYLSTFKSSLGTDVGSSTSYLVNELNRDLEIIKTASVGIPLGKQTFDTPLPEKSEGYYGALSKELMTAELEALSTIYEGQPTGAVEGYGLREAVSALEVTYNGGSLSDAIHDQFTAAKNALSAIPEPFSTAVVSNRPPVESAYNEIQKLVVLLKADMASALSILITYTDADGD